MTLSELIAQLTEIAQECGDHDPEVRLAIQPRWAFEHRIGGVASVDPNEEEVNEIKDFLNEADPLTEGQAIDDARARLAEIEANKGTVVYLGEGGQIGYLPGGVSDAVWG